MKRIQLTFSRNKADETHAYRIFRSLNPNVTRRDQLVMEVAHPPLPEPVFIKEDALRRETMYVYYATHGNIMPISHEHHVKVYLNGVDIALMGITFSIDYVTGMFEFSAGLHESDEVIADYFIDGIQVFDTDEIDQPESVKHLGPPARDRTEPSIPENLMLLPDHRNGRIILTWGDSSAPGQTYYYRVESVDAFGNFSNFSQERSVHLSEQDDGYGYYVERSLDGVNWEIVSKQDSTEYIGYDTDSQPPSPATNLKGEARLLHGESKANVRLTWDEPADGGSVTLSSRYRVRSVSNIGVPSLPSVIIGPVPLPAGIDRYVIRRKVHDGSIPSLSGNDAITVTTLPPDDTFELEDMGVKDNTTYTYAVYLVNRLGVHSIAASLHVEVGDATPPDFHAAGLKASNYSYLV